MKAMQSRWPKAAELLAAAEHDVLAFMAFSVEHWTRIYSINPLERLNRETPALQNTQCGANVERCTEVVGVFPDEASVVRLVGAVLAPALGRARRGATVERAEALLYLPPEREGGQLPEASEDGKQDSQE